MSNSAITCNGRLVMGRVLLVSWLSIRTKGVRRSVRSDAVTACEAVVKGHDEQGFRIAIGTAAEVLVFAVHLDVKGPFGDLVSLELLHLAVSQIQRVTAVKRHELNPVAAQMQPTTAVVDNITGSERVVGMWYEERGAASCFESILKLFLRSYEIHRLIKICRREIRQRFGVTGL